MKPFVFSADSHIMEPPSIFLDGLPASLKKHAIHSRKEGDFLITGTEEKVIYRLRVGQHREKALGDNERRGIREIPGRLEDMELTDYKVRVLSGQHGTGAKVRVLVESKDGIDSWGTVGVSYNIIEASWQALVDSINYKLMKDEKNHG